MAQQSIVLTCKAKSFIENYLLFLLNTFYLKKNNYSGPFPNFKKKKQFSSYIWTKMQLYNQRSFEKNKMQPSVAI